MKPVEVIQVIRTRLTRRGTGDDHPYSPVRIVEQYWTMDGTLLFEVDPCPNADDPTGFDPTRYRTGVDPTGNR